MSEYYKVLLLFIVRVLVYFVNVYGDYRDKKKWDWEEKGVSW